MAERICWKNDKGFYQPRIRAVRIRDLHIMREYTHRPMTVLVDEALSIYLSTFLRSPDYLASQKMIDSVIDKIPEPNESEHQVLAEQIQNT